MKKSLVQGVILLVLSILYGCNSGTDTTVVYVPAPDPGSPGGPAVSDYPRYAYTTGWNGSVYLVSSFVFDSVTGIPKWTGEYATGIGSHYIAADPSGQYVYSANWGDGVTAGSVSQYRIGAEGRLTRIDADAATAGIQDVAAGIKARYITVHPGGQYVYVINDYQLNAKLALYSIGTNGGLTPLVTPFMNISYLSDIEFSPDGAYVYLSHGSVISQYNIGAGGQLNLVSDFDFSTSGAAGIVNIEMHSSGNYMYVSQDNGLLQLNVGADGSLTPMTTAYLYTGLRSYQILIDPIGSYLYVNSLVDDSISQYSIGADGALSPIAPYLSMPKPLNQGMVFEPRSRQIYLTDSNSQMLRRLKQDDSGVLTELQGVAATSGTTNSIAIVRGGTPVMATPRYAYVTNQFNGTVSTYTINTNGTLAPHAVPPVAAGAHPKSVAVHPSGKLAYAANFTSNNISQYSVRADGSLAPLSSILGPIPTVAAGNGPSRIKVNPFGNFVYVLNETDSAISWYSVSDNPLTYGNLALAGTQATVPAGGVLPPRDMIFDLSGRYAYVLTDFNLILYRLANTGSMIEIPVAGSPLRTGMGQLVSAAQHPNMNFVYVVGATSRNVAQLIVGEDGYLQEFGMRQSTGPGPASIAVHPSGKAAYVANSGESTVSQYQINIDGVLQPMSTPKVATAGGFPVSITVDPTGQFAYTTDYSGATLSQYTIGTDGELLPMTPGSAVSEANPSGMAIQGIWQ